MSLLERDAVVIWHPYTQMKTAGLPVPIVKGQGLYLTDENGKQYMDAISSWWVNIHGHAHPYIAQKVAEQLNTLEHVIFSGFTHEPAIELAERLLKCLPPNQSKIFYSDNGSTAVEVALKMAIQFWYNQGKKKQKIIALEHSYHGDTFGAMSVSARSAFTNPFYPFLFEVIHIPFPHKNKEFKAVDALKEIMKNGKDEIAAFIFEPLVLGAGGMLMYEEDTLNELLGICNENEVLTIADEVMTGFGRTGKMFASEYLAHQPDILCLSKGLTGGTMALGVTSCTQKIYGAFLSDDKGKTFFHGHSFTANPVACAASLASLDLLLDEICQKNIHMITNAQQGFADELQKLPNAENVRNKGSLLAFDFKTHEQTSYFNSVRDQLYQYFLDRGIIIRPLGNTIYLMPPYCIQPSELNRIYDAIKELLVMG
ncbi:MAG: adenosylmethionine--8-amino-7-oxononanoate transaminase [Bacteroidetes bacterium]|nr:adenosylmethionine--8-amino-7-oxononanoate transaminase [Bacteroidota bacterium]